MNGEQLNISDRPQEPVKSRSVYEKPAASVYRFQICDSILQTSLSGGSTDLDDE